MINVTMCLLILIQKNINKKTKLVKIKDTLVMRNCTKKVNLLCLFILLYPHKGNGKNKKHFNLNAHEEKIYSKENKIIRFIYEFE